MRKSVTLNELVSLSHAASIRNVPYTTLKEAAQRFEATAGQRGLRSIKPIGSRDWVTTLAMVDDYIANEYTPHSKAE